MLFAVCDDDNNITGYIKNKLDSIKDVKTETVVYNSVSELTDAILDNNTPDAIFMDICVGKYNGIDELKKIKHKLINTPVIFITGYPEFCQDIFIDFKPWGLLTKPIDDEKFMYYVNKIIYSQHNKDFEINITSNGRKTKILCKDILFIESRERKVIYNTTNGLFEEYIKLDKAMQKLSNNFLRIHKSYAVNLKYIKDFSKSRILLITGSELPISRSHCDDVKKTIFEYKSQILGI